MSTVACQGRKSRGSVAQYLRACTAKSEDDDRTKQWVFNRPHDELDARCRHWLYSHGYFLAKSRLHRRVRGPHVVFITKVDMHATDFGLMKDLCICGLQHNRVADALRLHYGVVRARN